MGQERVFDTSAIVAFLRNEPGADRIEEIIAQSKKEGLSLYITTVNLGEVWYAIARQRRDADAAVLQISMLGFVPVDLTWEIAREAAALRIRTKLPFGDCCAAACAKVLKLPLVTCDYDFKIFEKEVKIAWVKGR